MGDKGPWPCRIIRFGSIEYRMLDEDGIIMMLSDASISCIQRMEDSSERV